MIILGVDPGTLTTGFGIIKYYKNEFHHVYSGIIKPSKYPDLASKLELIYEELSKLIKTYKPDEFSIETAFYGKNVQSAMKIGYARGVSILVAAHNKVPTNEYSPREVKKAVVGNGAASKEQVEYMVSKLLNLKTDKMKLDETDAIAVAICHALKLNTLTNKSGNWKSFIAANPDRVIE